MKHQTNFAILASLLLIASSCLFGQSVAAQEQIKFPVGVGTKTIGTNMFWLATKKGFFDEFGLDVQPILLRGSSITMQALVSESLLFFIWHSAPRMPPSVLRQAVPIYSR